jgi:undecaprenyl-diphosphatase
LEGSSAEHLPARKFCWGLILATALTGVVGIALKEIIERVLLRGLPHAEVEMLFSYLPLIAFSLFAAGLLILFAGVRENRKGPVRALENSDALWIGAVQGLCLPFRGFSRSGATISTALLRGLSKNFAESFSFALAVILTPPVIARELLRLMKSGGGAIASDQLLPGLLGMVFSFGAGLVALRWLSRWLEEGRWKWFGYYCLAAAVFVAVAHWRHWG